MTASPRSLSLVALALGVVILVVQIRVIAGGQTWDDVRYHTEVAPPRLAAAGQVLAGDVPAWWDGSGLGVTLAGEPSHGAMYPLTWLASSPHALDLILIAHLAWLGLGVAVWARRRASDRSALVAGVLIATTGVLASSALRGALPALAHLPWLGVAIEALVGARLASGRATGEVALISPSVRAARAACAIGALVGMIALAGELAVLADAIVLALVLGLRRQTLRWLVPALAAGLAIGAVQWLPAIRQLPLGVGAEVAGLPLARLLELVVPSASGASAADHALPAIAGAAPWAPSLFVGAPLLALAAVRTPARAVLALLGVLAGLALVAGRGGWPAWLGAPELHVAAFVIVLAAGTAAGLDALVGGQRRAVLALAGGAGLTALALAALGVLRAQRPELAASMDRALVDGALGVVCMAGAVALAWRTPGRRAAVLFALVVAPSVGAAHSISPMIDRATVDEPPAWVVAAEHRPPPIRAFRPQAMHEQASVGDAFATLAGTSAWRWGIAAAYSEDPARLPVHDRAWLAAAHEGGALLDRYGIGMAILPSTLIGPRHMTALGQRNGWSLVELPVAPVAAVMRGWQWSIDPDNALKLLYPEVGGTSVPRGSTVLAGSGDPGPAALAPRPCGINAWRDGDIDLACTTDSDGYAVVSSTPAPGWSVEVDGRAAAWLTADVLRRAVAVSTGAHRVHWHYAAPGMRTGALAGLAGVLVVIGLGAMGLRRRRAGAADDMK